MVNRTLILAVYNFPIIINLFAGALAAQKFINSGQWRWGYGHICIVIFVASVPLLTVLWNLQFKASKSGLLRKGSKKYIKATSETKKESLYEKIIWFVGEIDLVGSILLIAGLFLILLPLILATSWGGWGSSKSNTKTLKTSINTKSQTIR